MREVFLRESRQVWLPHGTPYAPPRLPEKANPHRRAAAGGDNEALNQADGDLRHGIRAGKRQRQRWTMHAADHSTFQGDGGQRCRLGSYRRPPGADSR